MDYLIYLSLALIIIGLFIVFYSAIANYTLQAKSNSSQLIKSAKDDQPVQDFNEKKLDQILELINEKNKPKETQPNNNLKNKIDLIFRALKKKKPLEEKKDQFLPVLEKSSPNLPEVVSTTKEEVLPASEKPLQNEFPGAELYEDRSGLVDYAIRVGTIDPTLEKYKLIKRIGRGILVVHDDGLTFDQAGRMYRFDFKQISNIYSGQNYLALTLLKSSSVRLFLHQQIGEVVNLVNSKYKNFLNG